ncbi:protein kinase domain-containing protein [Tellurirhabdus bombi]|uniref:protein kinase domain-containing protein n=1 Tax=Tellurirhabdus bombi TaxID=2907205 RepID=UPI001F42C4B4|nr:protein kinase [Tellurirhabdus bombi]
MEKISTFQNFRKRYPIRPHNEAFLLGSGSYGKVVRVEDQLETEWVAVKISEFKGDDSKSLKAEVELAQRVPRQTNIARYDTCYRLETDTGVVDFAIMKYYPDGNLAMLMKQNTLQLSHKEDIVRGILKGLQHLHLHRIIHRDFKPANILISRDNQGRLVPKIADFGLSKLVHQDEMDSSDFELSDGRGTPSYKAPEQIEGNMVSFNLDLWAFGVIVYELFTGEKPFVADTKALSEQAVKREIELKIVSVSLPARLQTIPEPYQTLIRRCLVKDIRKRARKAEELLNLLDGVHVLPPKNLILSEASPSKQTANEFDAPPDKREGNLKVHETPRAPVLEETDIFVPAPQQDQEVTDLFDTAVLTPASGGQVTALQLVKKRDWWPKQPYIAATITVAGLVVGYTFFNLKKPASKPEAPVVVAALPVGKPKPEPKSPEIKPTNNSKASESTKTIEAVTPLNKPVEDLAKKEKEMALAQAKVLAEAEAKRKEDERLLRIKIQDEYNELIEKGLKAVNKENRKADAIGVFTQARQLAEKHGLSIDKATASYSEYLAKANRIFGREDYEGAKAWYQVAQALQSTKEVEQKIRECERNQ